MVHIIGLPVELECRGKDIDIRRIEWRNDENITLMADNDTNSLSLTYNTSRNQSSTWLTCMIFTYSGHEQQKHVLISVKGKL